MRLPKDIINAGLYTKPNFFLCQTDKERICKLETTETKGSFKFNSLSEISFDTSRVYNDVITGETKVNPYYDLIEALRLIYVEGFGYFELQGPELSSDGIEEKKSCTAYSLEYTLAQKYLENFYVNMGTTESIEVLNATSEKDIVPITLYNPSNKKLSLLHLVLEEIYGWKIGHVDSSLRTLSRQFEVDRESVYDFLMNEVCEKFNCYIIFDTINNTINVYAESLTAKFIGDGKTNTFTISPPFAQIGTVSVDGYKTTRWGYKASTGTLVLEDIPEFGAHIEVVDGALTEWETDVFVSFDNLAQEVNINYDADEIKTQLAVTYGDDYDIREVNLGLPYLTDISYYYTVDWMGQDLYDAYTKYMQKSNNSQAEYTKNSQEILKWNDYIAYEENRLSLEYSLVESVNSTTVGTYYTRQENADGSYYYSEVSLPGEYVVDVDYYSNVTTNVNEEKVSSLYEVLKKYFYAYFSGEADGITSALDELKALIGFEFIDGYTLLDLHNNLKSAKTLANMDAAVNKFLKELWPELGRTPLKTLYLDSYKTIQETNIKAGWSNKSDKNYGNYYPVTLFISSIESAISQRDKTINGYIEKQSIPQKANAAISDSLLMYNNFTEAQLIRLSAFLREDELHLDDIVETGLDDLSSSFKIKQDAMESGRIELQKISQPQLQFSMTMANIYALPEFEPIINQFQLGKVIRVCLRPDYIKQSRLLQVDINFDDFSDFSCEFGELTSLRTQSDIHADLLSQAITAGKSVATNSSYWTRGSDTASSIDLKIQQGLLDATTQIKAMDGTQGVVIDKYGIKLQKKMENGEIDPHQTWLVNNMILMSDDGFKTSRSALGELTIEGNTYYGLIAEMVLSGYIEGSIIKGGTIQIGEYIDEEGNKRYTFEVDKDGNVTMHASKIDGYATSDDLANTEANFKLTTDSISSEVSSVKTNLEQTNSKVTQTADAITAEVNRATKAEGELNSKVTQTATEIRSEVSAVSKNLTDNYPTTTEMNSAITQSANLITTEVSKKVGSDEIISKINQSAEQISISASKIKFEGLVTANNNFKILTDGSIEAKNANISGDITATSLTLGSNVKIGTGNISGLSKVATSGSYSDLSGKPTIPTSVTQLTGGANILYADNVSISSATTSNGVTKQTITVGSKTYTSITSGDFVLTNVGLGTNTTDGSKSYTLISKDGLLTAKNAIIYGTVYATNGKFTGTVSGSTIEGGTINVNNKFIVDSNGAVKINGNDDTSSINFGEAFAVSNKGLSATSGNFESLKVGGQDVLTANNLGYKIIVSASEPSGTGIIWLCPTSVKSVEYTGPTPSSRNESGYLGNSSVTRSFSVKCSTSDTLPNSTYTYKVKFPIIAANDSGRQTNVGFNVTATKSDNSNLKVTFPTYTLATIEAWKVYNIEVTVESSVNLCATSTPITVSIKSVNAVNNGYLHVQKDSTIYLTSTDKNATGSTQPCSIYYKP